MIIIGIIAGGYVNWLIGILAVHASSYQSPGQILSVDSGHNSCSYAGEALCVVPGFFLFPSC